MASETARKRALENALKLVDANLMFPQNVFRDPKQYRLLFFETERIFGKGFVAIAKAFLEADHGEVVCLLNLWRLEKNYDLTAIYLDRHVDEATYWSALTEGKPEEHWLYSFGERYVCCSDSASWAMYCERSLDLTAIAVRSGDFSAFEEPLTLLRARGCKEAFDSYYEFFPTNDTATRFHSEMAKNYPTGSVGEPA